MRQFSLTQLLMAVPLVAILLTLVRSEGCGRRYSMVGSLDFSPDGERLAVARYDAHDANTPLKLYMADVSRVISVVDVESASVVGIVEQALKPGNRGTGFGLYRRGRQAIAFGAAPDTIFVQDFDGDKVTPFDLNTRQWRAPLQTANRDFRHLAISPDRKLLAAGSREGVVLWDVTSGTESLKIATPDSPFLGSPLIAISADGTLIATVGDGVRLWNAKDGTPRSISNKLQFPEMATALAFSPASHVVAAASDDGLSVYDMDRGQQRELLRGSVSSIAFSPDGRRLAVGLDHEVAVVDLATGQRLRRLEENDYVSALAFSPKGDLVAIGDSAGNLLLWDPDRNDYSSRITAPGRTNYSWPFPLGALGLWCFVSWWIWIKRKTAKADQAITLANKEAVRGPLNPL